MARHVALLYSIVLGRGRRVIMAGLRELAGELGFGAPQTLLASGNLLLDAVTDDPREVEARLEPAFAARFGKAIPIIVRPADRWPGLVAGNPFAEAAARMPSRVVVRVMREPLPEGAEAAFERYRAPGEALKVVEGDLWGVFPDGQGSSKLVAALTPARTGGAGTFRNWNTVRRIDAALRG